jgi:hypothetical protein
MQNDHQTGQNGVDEASWIAGVAARGMKVVFNETSRPTAEFDELFHELLQRLTTHWSEDEPCVQFWAHGPRRDCMVVPLSEDEETMDLAFDYMPQVFPRLIEHVGATSYCFLVTGDVPAHPEVIIVGGAGICGERALGWMALTRDADGHEQLGSWVPFAVDDEEYCKFAASSLLRLLEPHQTLPSRLPARANADLRWFLR